MYVLAWWQTSAFPKLSALICRQPYCAVTCKCSQINPLYLVNLKNLMDYLIHSLKSDFKKKSWTYFPDVNVCTYVFVSGTDLNGFCQNCFSKSIMVQLHFQNVQDIQQSLFTTNCTLFLISSCLSLMNSVFTFVELFCSNTLSAQPHGSCERRCFTLILYVA